MSGLYFVVVEVYAADGTTLIAELPRRWDVQGSDPLNVPGVGQVSVSMTDAVMTRHPTILNMGNWVKYRLCDGLGVNKVIAAMHIRKRSTKFIGSAEFGDYVRTVSGPMVHGILADFIVKHETQPPRQDASETRAYSWTSPPGEWYSAGDWASTIVSAGIWKSHITNARSGTTAKPSYQPEKWPDPKAEWIYVSTNDEWQFFRSTVTIPTGGLMVKMFLSADEIVRGFLDGDLVISRDEYENGYKGYGEYKTFLPAGTHYISIMMRSKASGATGDGVDGLLFTLCSLKTDGSVDKVLKRSKVSGWLAHGGLPVPGWNQAQILRSMIAEAQARGNDSANRLTVDFGATVDSNGDTWTTELNRNFRIGTKVLDAQSQLCELGSFDVWIDPATFHVKAYKRRGTDRSLAVVLEPGRNLIGWQVDEVDVVANKATVHYDGGWLEYTNAGSVTTYGEREVGVSLGAIADDATAEAIAGAHVESRRAARKRAGASDQVEADQDEQPSAAIIPVQGAIPFVDFSTGDSVKVPNETGVAVKQRVMGLSFAEDNATGQLSFDPEFAEED